MVKLNSQKNIYEILDRKTIESGNLDDALNHFLTLDEYRYELLFNLYARLENNERTFELSKEELSLLEFNTFRNISDNEFTENELDLIEFLKECSGQYPNVTMHQVVSAREFFENDERTMASVFLSGKENGKVTISAPYLEKLLSLFESKVPPKCVNDHLFSYLSANYIDSKEKTKEKIKKNKSYTM